MNAAAILIDNDKMIRKLLIEYITDKWCSDKLQVARKKVIGGFLLLFRFVANANGL
jgi:hypothetical protein